MSGKVTFPQRGRIRGLPDEEIIVHGVKREAGVRLYEVEFADGQKAEWLPAKVELLGPVDD